VKETFNAILTSLLLLTMLGAGSGVFCPSPGEPARGQTGSSAQKLHRADFRVTGASCVACLRRIGKTIREQKGVMKADVSIFKPYWAIVVYDSGQTSLNKLLEVVSKEKVKFEDIEDRAISSVPVIVIPKGINSAESRTPAAPASAAAPAPAH
jgi:copper chaperone CopZ